ncbi:glycoside hydrolase family 31 protein [uncultured Muribaculum sp.]|uniref:glycoside hydrolase family 31 protein n=1 Tax=uncultured Muribaculum sp. TaxID=1918613 RepID=UPI0025E3EBBE|nr:glycoside hydrolase family 31 protein [uncultured Muribaculum sp.]
MLNLKPLILSTALAIAVPLCAQGYDNNPVDTDNNQIDNPIADEKAIVTCGNARFTILTPQMVRMEWSADGKWEDNKSLTFINRNLDVPRFKKSTSKKGATITTDALTLKYKNDGRPFDAKNLEITFALNGKKVKWVPGTTDSLNLMGTTRTLDRANGYKLGREPMEQGLLSRSGWALVDDSKTPLMTPVDSHWKEWVVARPDGERQDWYFMAYGHNYKEALADYQKVAGRATLPPKYTFGYWWSRYWQYSDNELVDIVDKLRSFDIPLDVLIIDMDWHDTFGMCQKNPAKDEYGQRIGWTGYTWQKQLFPNPANFLEWTNRENLKTALNLHPASGIQPYEECYDAFVKDYGWNEKGKSVPFKIDEEKWADSYFNVVLSPMEKMGVDFWWLDWQQWLNSKYTKGLSNTFWLNHTFYNHAKERTSTDIAGATQSRPFIYHRWGGLGSHRYPLGFSGDIIGTWESLAFLPWFTSTASNVNYGYWGHDIGGHYNAPSDKITDPEKYLRWLQYGVFTPIFKTHSTKDNRIIRYLWAFPDHQFKMRDAIRLRYTLAPYIYNAARANYDTGVAMCRPMYYEYPETDKAYNVPEQFFFGDDIIATAVAAPVDSVTGLAPRPMWLPEGKWYDYSTGNMYEGDTTLDLSYTLDENPFFVRAGAIIPMNPGHVRSLQQQCDTLVLSFIPGADGVLTHYEDDGVSEEYKHTYATTRVTRKNSGNNIDIKIEARKGMYKDAPSRRAYELRFPASMPPQSVTVAGKDYPYSRFPQPGTWSYEGLSLSPVVYTEMLPVDTDTDITLHYSGTPSSERLYGKQRIFNRCLALTPEFKEEQCNNGDAKIMLPEGYLKVSQCPYFILENPQEIVRYLDDFDKAYSELPQILEGHKYSGKEFRKRLTTQLGLNQ